MIFELYPVDTLTVIHALSRLIEDEEVNPDDRLIAYRVKASIKKQVSGQLEDEYD